MRHTANVLNHRRHDRSSGNNSSDATGVRRETVSQDLLTTVAASSMLCGNRTLERATKKKEIKATGSPLSIIWFAKSRGLDKNQQRAFEVITSSFVLSYYVGLG